MKKRIMLSTNMTSIRLVIPEITSDMLEFCESKHNFAQ